jgi:hypothetical protein
MGASIDEFGLTTVIEGDQSSGPRDERHRRRLTNLIDRLPNRIRSAIHWLLEPSRGGRAYPAGVALILGGFFSILPVFGLWMLPLGLILLTEDLPIVRRGVARVLDWLENRWPHWFARPRRRLTSPPF